VLMSDVSIYGEGKAKSRLQNRRRNLANNSGGGKIDCQYYEL
jgi:hypothetical protein